MIITNLFTHIEYRHRGLATFLLNKMYNIILNMTEITSIVLTDSSDFFQQPNNIYVLFGFKYDIIGQPEMTFIIN